MKKAIHEFSETERWVVDTTLKERYGHLPEVKLADVELRLSPADRELTTCPALFWAEREAGFVLAKTGDNRFRCQFYYSVREQYGTGRDEYDDLGECVVALLKMQADHEAQRQANV